MIALKKTFLSVPIYLLIAAFVGVTLMSPKVQAQSIDPRTKAVLTMAAYGTAGGALLGTASLAFGTKGRAVAIGASLGLYAGLIFGSYIIINHRMQQYPPAGGDYYPDTDQVSPYESGGGWDWFGPGGYWHEAIRADMTSDQMRGSQRFEMWGTGRIDTAPPLFINVFQYNF